jgi:hypothetical protein
VIFRWPDIAITPITHAQNGFLDGYWCNRLISTVISTALAAHIEK